MNNIRIREYAKKNDVLLWEIAQKLNINDGSLSRKLRKEFSKEEQKRVMDIIDSIANEKKGE